MYTILYTCIYTLHVTCRCLHFKACHCLITIFVVSPSTPLFHNYCPWSKSIYLTMFMPSTFKLGSLAFLFLNVSLDKKFSSHDRYRPITARKQRCPSALLSKLVTRATEEY